MYNCRANEIFLLKIDIYLSICLSVYLSIYLSIYLFIYLSIHHSIFLSTLLFDFREVLEKLEQSTNGLMRTVDEQGERIER